jgi:hypothetical protein
LCNYFTPVGFSERHICKNNNNNNNNNNNKKKKKNKNKKKKKKNKYKNIDNTTELRR